MTKNLVAIGNSLGIVIDKPILELLKIERDTPLDITTDGNQLIIRPLSAAERAKRLDDAVDRVMNNHHDTLKKLAE
jgi:antitoxin MazE